MRQTRRSRQQLSIPGLAFAILAFFSILSIALRLSPGWGTLVLAAGMAILGVAAWVFGFDSRDNDRS